MGSKYVDKNDHVKASPPMAEYCSSGPSTESSRNASLDNFLKRNSILRPDCHTHSLNSPFYAQCNMAEGLKAEGNKLFAAKDFHGAEYAYLRSLVFSELICQQ